MENFNKVLNTCITDPGRSEVFAAYFFLYLEVMSTCGNLRGKTSYLIIAVCLSVCLHVCVHVLWLPITVRRPSLKFASKRWKVFYPQRPDGNDRLKQSEGVIRSNDLRGPNILENSMRSQHMRQLVGLGVIKRELLFIILKKIIIDIHVMPETAQTLGHLYVFEVYTSKKQMLQAPSSVKCCSKQAISLK